MGSVGVETGYTAFVTPPVALLWIGLAPWRPELESEVVLLRHIVFSRAETSVGVDLFDETVAKLEGCDEDVVEVDEGVVNDSAAERLGSVLI